MFTAGSGLAALAVVAVHGVGAPPLAVLVYADAVIGLSWLLAAFLLLRGLRPSPVSPGDDAPGPRHHHAVRFSADGEPAARSHWTARHRY
ncbi:hypothetical protein ACFVFH_21390 [Streptomyces sp. NPDC057697]|uniref:hypothetical protein n=1 Tax=Streptomyces sp. NPDC057697 TaxID=3346219 RepID=UPI0036ADDC16